MEIGQKEFDFNSGQAYIMGILNVTPDSFSDGGRHNNLESARQHVEEMIGQGVDIIDIGAESTRPGHTQISIEEECQRLLKIISMVKGMTDIPISIDCYRAPVAKAAIDAGADMINDIWGLTYDEEMAKVIAEADIPVCIMHNRKTVDYHLFMREYYQDIYNMLSIAKVAGIQADKIIVDPGVGFAKSFDRDLEVMHRLDTLCQLGYPVLLGTSRKRMVGHLSNLPVAERDEATAATTAYGYLKGARIFRVHNVGINRRVVDTIAGLEGYLG